MAIKFRTVSRWRKQPLRRKRREEDFDEDRPLRRRRRRSRYALAVMAATLVLLIVALPWIVSRSMVFNRVLAFVAADVDGSVQARSASLGWFSPSVIRGLEVRGTDGQPFVRVTRIESERGLWGLLTSRSDLGRVKVQSPQVVLTLDSHRSNAEKILAAYLSEAKLPVDDSAAEPAVGTAIELHVIDGQVSIVDQPRDQQWQFDHVELWTTLPAEREAPGTLKASAELVDLGRPSKARVEATFQRTATGGYVGQGQVHAEGIPVELANWWIDQASPGTHATGRIDAQMVCQARAATPEQPSLFQVDGQLVASALHVTAPWLGRDEIRLARLDAPCRLRQVGSRLDVEQLALHCDVGQVAYSGSIDTASGLVNSLTSQAYEVTGDVDLARLARMLPETVRVRAGTEIKAGGLRLRLASAQNNGVPTWNGMLETSNLVAAKNGRDITWQQPLKAKFAAHRVEQGMHVDELHCESSFLQVDAEGAPDLFAVSATYDLKQLGKELNQFFDLGQAQLDGDGWSYLKWQRQPDGRFEANAETQIRQLIVALPERRVWREENLVALATLKGTADAVNQWTRVDTAQIRMDSALDRFEARLVAPVTPVSRQTTWPLDVTADGQIAQWLPRLAPVTSGFDGWEITGQGRLKGRVHVSSDELALVATEVSLANLHAWGNGWFIDDPLVRVAVQANWSAPQHRAAVDQLTINSQALELGTRALRYEFPAAGSPSLAGQIDYRGDLAQLMRWRLDPAAEAQVAWAGQLQGQAQITRTAQATKAELQSTVQNLVARQSGKDLWRENQLALATSLEYDNRADRLQLHRCEIRSQGLALVTQGAIGQFKSTRQIDLDGKLDYDLSALAALVGTYLGSEVELRGRDSRAFSLHGPLGTPAYDSRKDQPQLAATSLARLDGRGALGWESGSLYGFDLGKGELQARLLEGKLQLDLLKIPLSGGTLNLQPVVIVEPRPMLVTLPAGKALDHARISPEMCQRFLKYIAPVMADVGTASGQFSIDLQGGRIPVAAPSQGDIAGQATIHSAEVAAGPLVEALTIVLQRPSTARLSRESVVPFRMVQGRIYHQNLQLVFPDLTIRTYGSVGLDQSLALMAEMPVPPKWIGNNSLGAALQNQTIRLPIAGTLSKPVIDQVALQQASAQFLRDATVDSLRNEMNNQLDRLIRPR
ncbi:MAG: hypothetical protein K1X74_00490 [Pirellulales bacterium]|nr:hypothetical protein [Pirellulales bacterium]